MAIVFCLLAYILLGDMSGSFVHSVAMNAIQFSQDVPTGTLVGFALIAFLYGVFVIIKTLVLGIDVPGYASLLVVMLFIGSLQLICLGVLGEYIGRIYFESKQRPLYLIRKRYSSKD